MKCLSLWQPWASLITNGHKQIETRSWSTSFRGPLAIHAAKTWNQDLAGLCECWPFTDVLPPGDPADLPKGCVIAVAELYDCKRVDQKLMDYCRRRTHEADLSNTPCEYHYGDFSEGRWLWFLRGVRPIEPVYVRGHQGLFDVELERLEAAS